MDLLVEITSGRVTSLRYDSRLTVTKEGDLVSHKNGFIVTRDGVDAVEILTEIIDAMPAGAAFKRSLSRSVNADRTCAVFEITDTEV